MIGGQSDKYVVAIAPATQSIATNATEYGYVDTIGYDHARFIYMASVGTATGVCAKQFAIREGTNSTAATAITALTGGTATAASVAFVCGALSTSAGVAMVLDVDLRERERYLRVQVSPGESATEAVLAILSRGKIAPPADSGTYVVNHVIG